MFLTHLSVSKSCFLVSPNHLKPLHGSLQNFVGIYRTQCVDMHITKKYSVDSFSSSPELKAIVSFLNQSLSGVCQFVCS